jgi:hypothetical protein
MIRTMTDDRLITAIGRLERALSRIEAKGVSPALPEAPLAKDLERLQQRHLLLRKRTQSVVERLDRLLDEAASEDSPPNGARSAG